MSRDTYKDFHLIRKVKQLLTETGMIGKSYFNHRKRKVSKISAGGRLRKNNQALSYLSVCFQFCSHSHFFPEKKNERDWGRDERENKMVNVLTQTVGEAKLFSDT